MTIPSHLEDALEKFRSALPARPSLASVVEAALEEYLLHPGGSSSRLPAVMRARPAIRELAQVHGVQRIGLFGSVASATDGPDSDVDFWVEASEPLGLFKLAAMRQLLQEVLQAPVDVVTLGGLSDVEREAIFAASVEL